MPKWLIIFTAYVKIPLICKGPAVLSKHLHSPTHTIKPRDRLVVTKAVVVMNNMEAGRQESSAQYAFDIWKIRISTAQKIIGFVSNVCGGLWPGKVSFATPRSPGSPGALSEHFPTAIYTFSNLPNTVTQSRNPRPTNLPTTNIKFPRSLGRTNLWQGISYR